MKGMDILGSHTRRMASSAQLLFLLVPLPFCIDNLSMALALDVALLRIPLSVHIGIPLEGESILLPLRSAAGKRYSYGLRQAIFPHCSRGPLLQVEGWIL